MEKEMIQDQVALEKLQTFLQQNQLPYQDVTLEGSLYFTLTDEQHRLIGSGGLELYGKDALLRSLAVDEKYRGEKKGAQLVDDLLSKAKSMKIENIFLLTETARDFFAKKGFQLVERSVVPPSIRESTEFVSVCPQSAACMLYKIIL